MKEKLLESALMAITLALDELISDCFDNKGELKIPSRRIVMKMRGLLPYHCKNSLNKK